MQWIGVAVVLCLLWSCTAETPETTSSSSKVLSVDSTLEVTFFQENGVGAAPTSAFLPLLDSSYYTNRDSFVVAFRQMYALPSQSQLLAHQKTTLYGATDSLFWLRFDQVEVNSTCPQPLKEHHFIFDNQGQLLYRKQVHSAQFLVNAIDSMPIYLTIEHDCEGEGYHHAYILQEGDFLEVLNVFFENMPMTFDAKEDSSVFQAAGALEPLSKDVNGDGYPDLVLQGKRVQLYSKSGKRFTVQRPYRRDRIAYYFLYEPAKENFIFDPNFQPAAR